MKNAKESFPLFTREHFPITHNPTKNYGIFSGLSYGIYYSFEAKELEVPSFTLILLV